MGILHFDKCSFLKPKSGYRVLRNFCNCIRARHTGRIHLALLLLFILLMRGLNAQQFVGYLDLDYTRINYNDSPKTAPAVIYPCFVSDGKSWRTYHHDDYQRLSYQKKFYLYLAGKYLQHIYAAEWDRTTDGIDVLEVSQHQLPKAGEVSDKFHTFERLPARPPLLTLNKRIKSTTPVIAPITEPDKYKKDIDLFLVQQAAALQLGPVPRYTSSLVDTIGGAWQLDDSLVLIQANVNLQIHCYTDTVPFIAADNHDWKTIDKTPEYHPLQAEVAPVTGGPGYANLSKWTTASCFFLVSPHQTIYVDRFLQLMDIQDLDGDGKAELIFRKQGPSYIEYLLITNDLQTKIQHRAIQWW